MSDANEEKTKRIAIADDTLQIIDAGFYLNKKGHRIEIQPKLSKAISKSVLYTPTIGRKKLVTARALLRVGIDARRIPQRQTIIEVTTETSLEASKRMVEAGLGQVMCLNFASARTPGGGFKKGAVAQEETIARSSGLFPCISQMREMYDVNRKILSGFYSDHMIFSPDVPVFKDDEGEFLDKPHYVSFITAPAVNAGVVKEKSDKGKDVVLSVMKRRIEIILALSYLNKQEVLVLGAFGCGVFKNDPMDIANLFKEVLLENELYKHAFKKVVFAIYDPTPEKDNYKTFENILLGKSESS